MIIYLSSYNIRFPNFNDISKVHKQCTLEQWYIYFYEQLLSNEKLLLPTAVLFGHWKFPYFHVNWILQIRFVCSEFNIIRILFCPSIYVTFKYEPYAQDIRKYFFTGKRWSNVDCIVYTYAYAVCGAYK